MNNKRVRTKAMAMAVAAAMAVELCPVTAFAVTGEQVAADGTYTSTAQVNRTAQDDEDENGKVMGSLKRSGNALIRDYKMRSAGIREW